MKDHTTTERTAETLRAELTASSQAAIEKIQAAGQRALQKLDELAEEVKKRTAQG